MKEKTLGILLSMLMLFSCSSKSVDVSAVCMRDEIGNYVIKWETNPVLLGVAKIYVSDIPGKFDMANPVLTIDIKKGVGRYITQDNMKRKYFRITFNDKHPYDVAARYTSMDEIQNFRDVGGYKGPKGKNVKWGKLYRSGNISNLSRNDSIRLRAFGIRTIIDLRTDEEVKKKPTRFSNTNIIQIPIPCGNKRDIYERIQDNKARFRDGKLFMEDTYMRFIMNSTEEFSDAFQLLLNKDNYPILVTSDLGKDRVGLFMAMLFTMLDVPRETIIREYMFSLDHVDPSFMAKKVSSLSSDSQETMTVLLSVNESFLNMAFKEIENRFGSFDNFREIGLRLSSKKQQKLKDILLN